MANPDSLLNGQAQTVDPVVDADGVVYLKLATRAVTIAGADADGAPQAVADVTLLSGHGGQVVSAGPTRAQLRSASTPCNRVTVKAFSTNAGILYVGLSTVTANTNNTTGGFQLAAGEAVTFGIGDVNKVYIHGTAGEGASFAYEL